MSDTPRNNKTKSRGNDYIVQGSILAAAAVITKVIGVVYRIPLTNLLGDEGNGFYGYAYQVYAFALMTETKCFPCIYMFSRICCYYWIHYICCHFLWRWSNL